jgi:hypothetical protein
MVHNVLYRKFFQYQPTELFKGFIAGFQGQSGFTVGQGTGVIFQMIVNLTPAI